MGILESPVLPQQQLQLLQTADGHHDINRNHFNTIPLLQVTYFGDFRLYSFSQRAEAIWLLTDHWSLQNWQSIVVKSNVLMNNYPWYHRYEFAKPLFCLLSKYQLNDMLLVWILCANDCLISNSLLIRAQQVVHQNINNLQEAYKHTHTNIHKTRVITHTPYWYVDTIIPKQRLLDKHSFLLSLRITNR